MIVQESLKRDLARLVIWYPVRWFIRFLPVNIAFRFFRFLGTFHYKVASGKFSSLRENLNRAGFENDTIEKIICQYLQNHYLDRLHIFTYPRLLKKHELESVCRLEGIENLEKALEMKKGVIIALGHSGPIQLPLFFLGKMGFSVIQVGLPTDEGLSWIGRNVAFRLRMKYEGMIPVKILPANRFLRPLFKHLKENGVVMMNIDPAGGGRWVGQMERLPFFNSTIPFPLGSAQLSAKTDATVIPLSIHSDEKGRWLCQLHEPLSSVEHGSEKEFIKRLATWYEKEISREPGLWHFWDEFEPGKLC